MSEGLYKRVYFRAVRRAMLENETFMRAFMDERGSSFDINKLSRLDGLLMAIGDNDLYDVIMSAKKPSDFEGLYDIELLQEIAEFKVNK